MNEKRLPTYKVLELTSIQHPDYQRPIDHKRVQQIVDEFDEAKVRPPLVNERPNGTFVRVDGGHTTEAAIQVGIKRMPCAVIKLSTIDEEIVLFNDQRSHVINVSPISRLHANSKRSSGDPAGDRAKDILDGIKGAGWAYNRENVRGHRVITKSTGVEDVYDFYVRNDRDGKQAIINVLTTIDGAWGNNAFAADPNVARAVGKVLYEYNLTPAQRKKLESVDLTRIVLSHRGLGAQATKRDIFADKIRRELGLQAKGIFRKKPNS